ncbi:hypothetical protein MTYP_00411 [Methylophilaceae bacterium]|nr:hypothetical protein MTYP_00411 [Methylophilaceae bacterium]
MNARYISPVSSRGFTLVELLLVIFLLGSLALVATVFVDGVNEQSRFDETRARLEQIRRAIVGDTSRTLNGEPEIRGFVADMGRLPKCLRELTEGKCDDTDPDPALWDFGEISISGVSGVVAVGELYGGWRGPYLDTLPESGSGNRLLRDGWANVDETDDARNFGWQYSDLSGVAVMVQSLGSDSAVGQADAENPYQKDFPADGKNLVEETDWRLNLKDKALRVRIAGSAAADIANLRLQVYSMKDGAVSAPLTSDEFGTLSGVSAQFSDAVFSADAELPFGMHAALVTCADGSVFDGSCPGASPPLLSPYYFVFLPRAQLPTIQWNIQ